MSTMQVLHTSIERHRIIKHTPDNQLGGGRAQASRPTVSPELSQPDRVTLTIFKSTLKAHLYKNILYFCTLLSHH